MLTDNTRRLLNCDIHVAHGGNRLVGNRPSAVSPAMSGMPSGISEEVGHLTFVVSGGTLRAIEIPFSWFAPIVLPLSTCHSRQWTIPRLSQMQSVYASMRPCTASVVVVRLMTTRNGGSAM